MARIRNSVEPEIEDFNEGNDPTVLENYMEPWKEKLQKFLDAEDRVMGNLSADQNDSDKDIQEHERAFHIAKTTVLGLRREYDIAQVQPPSAGSGPGSSRRAGSRFAED